MNSITFHQMSRILNEVILDFLKEGKVPALRRVLDTVSAQVPTPGLPTTQFRQAQRHEPLDVADYNKFWKNVKLDLSVLFSSVYDQSLTLLRRFLFINSVSSNIEARIGSLTDRVTSIVDKKNIQVAFSDSFSSANKIDFSLDPFTGLPYTTSLIDLKEKCATLPRVSGSVVKQPLHSSTILYKVLSPYTSEEEVSGAPIANLLDDTENTVWILKVVAGGGGVTVAVELEAPEGTKANSIIVTPLNKATYSIYQKIGESLIGIGAKTTNDTFSMDTNNTESANFRIEIERIEGKPFESEYEYYIGMRNISLMSTEYVRDATVRSNIYSIPTSMDTHGWGSVRLTTDEEVPIGCEITHYISPDSTPSNWYSITPNTGLWTTIGARRDVASDLISFSDYTEENGRLIYTSSGSLVNAIQSSFYLNNKGTYITNMWRVRAYYYGWPWDSAHIPGPTDWQILPPGVEVTDIGEIYVKIREDLNTTIATSTSILGENTNYVWDTWIFVNQPGGLSWDTQYDTVNFANNLTNLDAALLLTKVYVNGIEATELRDESNEVVGLRYQFAPGWNLVSIYIKTLDNSSQPTDIDIGIQLFPFEKTPLVQPDSSDSYLPPIVSEVLVPDADITTTNWTSTGGDFFGAIDEGVAVNNADYVSATGNQSATLEMGMSNMTASATSIPHIEFVFYGRATMAAMRRQGHAHFWYSLDGGTTWKTINKEPVFASSSIPSPRAMRPLDEGHTDAGAAIYFPHDTTWGYYRIVANVFLSDEDALDNLRIKFVHDAHTGPLSTSFQSSIDIATVYCTVCYSNILAATPEFPGNSNIDFCRARRSALELVPEFDLVYNTPPLYYYRYSLGYSTSNTNNTVIKIGFDPRPTSRIGVSSLTDARDKGDPIMFRCYYTKVSDTTGYASPLRRITYRADLTTSENTKGFRPKLNSYKLEII